MEELKVVLAPLIRSSLHPVTAADFGMLRPAL
jgi:hypothetical protein